MHEQRYPVFRVAFNCFPSPLLPNEIHVCVCVFFLVRSNAVLTPQIMAHYRLMLHHGVKPLLILKGF